MRSTPHPSVTKVTEAFDEAWNSSTNRREAFLAFYRNYRQKYSLDEEEQFLNNVFSTITYETISTFRPFLCGSLPEITVVPREDSDMDKAQLMEQWQRYQWYVQKMDKKRKSLAFQVLLYGMGVLYHHYRLESREMFRRVPDPRTGELVLVPFEKRIYDDPDSEVVDVVNDFIPDPYGTSIDTCAYVIVRRYLRRSEVERLSKGPAPWYPNAPAVKALGEFYDDQERRHQIEEFDRYEDSRELAQAWKRGMVEVLEYWEDDRFIAVANRQFLLRDTPNPYYMLQRKPFSIFLDEDNPHEIWGVGEGEVVYKVQHEINTVKRMRIDAAKRCINQKWVAPANSGFDPAGIYGSDEDFVAECSLTDFLKPINPPNLEQIGLATEAELKAEGQNASGATPLFQGAMRGDERTATGSRIQQSNVLARATYKLDNFNDGLKSWMEINAALAAQYYPSQRTFRVLNDQGYNLVDIDYEDFLLGVDYEVASASANYMTRDDKLMMSQALLAQHFNDPWIDAYQLRRLVFRLQQTPMWQTILKSPEQFQKEQQQAMAMQQQAATEQRNHEIMMEMSKQVGDDDAIEPAQVG